MKELDDLDISERMRERIISKEIWKSQREYLKNLKKNNPKTYEKMRKKKREYLREWRKKHPNYNKIWLKKAYKKDPEKFKIYQKRYWLKKALSRNQD